MALLYVDTKMSVEQLSCVHKDKWDDAEHNIKRLLEYTTFRNDTQVDNITSIRQNLTRAKESENACPRFLSIVKIRLQIIAKAWENRL